MLEIKDIQKYRNYITHTESLPRKKRLFFELFLPCLVYGGIGAIAWAMRGSSGWGGFDGALIPGMAWAILWYFFTYQRGIDGRPQSFWLGIGVAIGGIFGYGQYASWIQGIFYTSTKVTPYISVSINPIYGYIWFWIVGAIWLGIGGVFLGWALENRYLKLKFNEKLKKWLPRLFIPIIFVLIGWILIKFVPQIIFPNYSTTLYTKASCPDCVDRTISTNTTNFIALMWWIGALFTAKLQKDKYTFNSGLILGIGFGFLYMCSAMWMLMSPIYPNFIDWWKCWELTAGLSGGVLIGIFQYRAFKWVLEENVTKNDTKNEIKNDTKNEVKNETEDHSVKDNKIFLKFNSIELRANILIILTLSVLLLIVCYGSSFQFGIFLDLYGTSSNSYGFPVQRILLLLPFAIIILIWMFYRIGTTLKRSRSQNYNEFEVKNIHEKLVMIFAYIVIFGVIIAWPTKIGILYVFYVCIALLSLNRINRFYRNSQ